MAGLVPRLYPPPQGFLRRLKETLASPGTLEAAIGYYRAMFDPSRQDPSLAALQEAAGRPVPVPSLYIHGLADGCLGAELIVPEELPAFFLAGVEVLLVEGAGHFVHLERPDVVNPRVVAFLGG